MDAREEEALIRKAQQTLLANRRLLAQREQDRPVVAGVKLTADDAPQRLEPFKPELKPGKCNRCGKPLPCPGICDACAAKENAAALRVQILDRRQRIPGEHRNVTWRALLAGGEIAKWVPVSSERMVRIHQQLEGLPWGGRAVIYAPNREGDGGAGTGKSTLAAAWLRARIDEGVSTAWWVSTNILERDHLDEAEGPSPHNAVVYGAAIVLDDLGTELAGAPERSGLVGQRQKPAYDAITDRARRGDVGRIVVTTSLDAPAMARFYGANVARRVYERADAVIDLGEAG